MPRVRSARGRARSAAWARCWVTATPGTLTYNFGGAAAGIDYRFDPEFLAGISVGYTHGTQWVNTFWAGLERTA